MSQHSRKDIEILARTLKDIYDDPSVRYLN